MAGEAADGGNDLLEVSRGEVGRSKMLNHIVKNEESNLESLLLSGSEALRDDLIAEFGDKTLHELAVSLE